MKRTKFNNSQDIQINSEVVARMALAKLLGTSFGGNRDLYATLGYPQTVGYSDYAVRYSRQDIAKAVIKRPVETSWAGDIQVLESKERQDTEFEMAWDALEKEHKLKSKFARLDRLTCLGKYGVLLLGFDDVTKQEDFRTPVTTARALKLLYIKPLGEQSAKINTYENNTKSTRYGMPLTYNITLKNTSFNAKNMASMVVHHTRVIHVAWDLMEDEVEGTPVMEAVFNRLMDLEKLVGGSAEMFWKGARPGYQNIVNPEYTLGSEEEKAMQKQVDEFEHGLRRILNLQGTELKDLAPQVADPTNHVKVQIEMISAVTGIPQRVLMGSERGELASGQDADAWKTLIQDRRTQQIEPQIVRPFIDRMIQYKVLPKPSTQKYTIMWSDLFAPSEKERAETGKTRAAAVQQFLQNPIAVDLIPRDAFVEFFLGLTKEQIELFNKMNNKEIDEEELFQQRLNQQTEEDV